MPERAVELTNCSQLRCIRPSAPMLLMVSRPLMLSTSTPCFCAVSLKVRRTTRLSGSCSSSPTPITSGTAIAGTSATGPPIQATITTKNSTNGRSTSVTRLAEVKKSRRLSNSRRLLANAPAEAGRAAMRMPSTCSKIRPASLMSAILPALSTK